MRKNEPTGAGIAATALKIPVQRLYARLAHHGVGVRGKSANEVLDALEAHGMKIPARVRSKLATLRNGDPDKPRHKAKKRRGNGHDSHGEGFGVFTEDSPRVDIARRLHLILVTLSTLEGRARERIARRTEHEDDLELVKICRFAQTGRDSDLQAAVPDVPTD